MRHKEMFLIVMRYLLQREDTSSPVAPGNYLYLVCSGGIEHDRPWLGVVKTVFWSLIAILLPLIFAMLTQ
jgi:hypothetical protein